MYLGHKFIVQIQLIGSSVHAIGNIFGSVIGSLTLHAVGQHRFIGFASQTAHLCVIGAQNSLAAFLDIAKELLEGLVYIFFCTIVVQMVIFNIGNNC